MNKIEPRLLKGFRDYGPREAAQRQELFFKIQTVFERFGFLPLSTPVLEYKDILMGKYGEDEKLIYSFKDNGGRDVAMRYDLTVPLARFVAQNQNQLVFPFKRYQIAPVWRADNPQKGRLREFYQCDVDVVGTESPLADADVIACLCKALEAVGLMDYLVRLNDRRNFAGLSVDAVRALDKVDKVGIDGVMVELEQKGVLETEIALVKTLLSNSTDLPYAVALESIQQSLIIQGVPEKKISIDSSIARGLDYYTSTVFEIIIPDKPEFGSICSGGRYDNLVDQFSSKSLPAVGGSIGIDRLFDAMGEMGLRGEMGALQAMVFNLDEKLENDYLQIAAGLREAGISTELYYEPTKLDKQFKYAESKGVRFAVILGEQEKQNGTVKVKNLKTREEKEVKLEELIRSLQ